MNEGGSVHAFPRRAAAVLCAAAAIVLLALGVQAADTQWWILDSPPDHARSESRGVVVRSDGALELGPAAVSTPLDSLSVVWSAVELKDGSVLVAGDGGRILRRGTDGTVGVWACLGAGQVLALALDGQGVVAGTGPDGLIYRVSARGDTSLLARTGERYVWGLASAGGGAWYAATGTRGRLLRVENGKVRIVADTEESNLVSILADGHGGVFAGGDSRGRVLHVRADGSLRTVFDASEDEIRALALGEDGAVYAAACSSPGATEEDKEGEPTPAKTAPPAGRSTVYRIVPDSSAVAWWVAPQPLAFALLSAPASAVGRSGGTGPWSGILVATGNRAGLYLVERAGGATQWLASGQGQITALAPGASGAVYAATSNPAVLWQLGPGRATRGELLSMPLDARRIARFGAIRWRGDPAGGRIVLATRSGNTEEPDTTWSAWAVADGEEQGGRVGSPPARYLQWRISMAGGSPHVESVETAWREQNQPPRVEDVLVSPQGQGFREGELQPRMEPVTQTLPGGQRVEYSAPSASTPRGLRDLPMWARGVRTVQWRASDVNGDALVFRLDVRAEPAGSWIRVAADLEQPVHTWDTSALPDGRYRLRVTASDAAANAVGEGLTAEALSQPFTIDNTPPTVRTLEARGEKGAVRVSGQAEDATGPLQRIEVALDEGAWRAMTPQGGLTDRSVHTFDVRVDDVTPGEHSVSVRAVDLAGNSVVRATRVRVPER